MSRLALLSAVFVAWCSACSGSKPNEQGTTGISEPKPEKNINVPGGGNSTPKGGPTAGGASTDDPRFHLKPEEGTLTIAKAEAKAGVEATASLKVEPASGYHIATDFPIKITLEPPDGVTLAKTELTAGGGDKKQGDADTLSEKMLAFGIKATASKAGAYEIKGVFRFGVCDPGSCHPKKQPITITVAAN